MNYFRVLYFFLLVGFFQPLSAEIKALGEFPKGDKLWLSTAVGEVAINPEIELFSAVVGDLDWKARDGELVQKDQVLFVSNSEKIELSLRDIELKEMQYTNSVIDITNGIQTEKSATIATRKELLSTIASMEMTKTERELLGEEFERKLQAEREELRQEVSSLSTKIDSDYYTRSQALQITALDLELDKMRFAHEQLIQELEVKAKTSGRLKVDLIQTDNLNSVVGRIQKEGSYEALIAISDRLILNTEEKDLAIEVRGDDGAIFLGKFDRVADEQVIGGSQVGYVFSLFSADDKEGVVPKKLSGSKMIRIFKTFPEEGFLVSKEPILMQYPDEIREKGWANFVAKRLPGGNLVFIGPRELFVLGTENEN